LGLGHYEGRGWRGFHHHATLCIAAYGCLVAYRLRHPGSKKTRAIRQTLALPEDYVPRGLEILSQLPALVGDEHIKLEPILDAVIRNSGILDMALEVRSLFEDPTSAFLSGSGFLRALCYTTKFMWALVLVAVAIFVILAVVIVVLIILAPETGFVTGVIAVLLFLAEWVITILIYSAVLVAVAVTIVYLIGKFLEWAFG
jgi:hypothetical protein